ncbi:MAG: SpoIIE family protein phosphatase [Clostridiales bacterium]
MSKILVIDDESAILENLKFVLELELDDHEILLASSGEIGLDLFKEHINDIDSVVTDMRMPKVSGMDVLKEIKNIMPEMSVIVLTGHGDMENAIRALKAGAFEYLLKPINADKLKIALENAINKKVILLNNKRLENELKSTNKFLQNIHDSAQKILLNMLPQKLPSIKGYNFFSKYTSCDLVGGDMYDIIETKNYICFYVFDVSSHGILASVITIILKSFIQNIKYTYSSSINNIDLKNIVEELNNVLHLNTSQEVFATLFMGIIDKTSQKFQYVSAGHIRQFLLTKHGISNLDSTGTILGVFEDVKYQSNELQLYKDDKIILFTDGVTEITRNDEMFGNNRIISILNSNKNNSISTLINNIIISMDNFSGDEQSDDTTILGIELK